MNKYERYYNKAVEEGKNARWMDSAVIPLAADIEEFTGNKVKISGPFGLRAEVIVSFEDRTHGLGIIVTPNFVGDDSHLELYYDTGEVTNVYGTNTLGWMNGFNNVTARLPDSLSEIVKLMGGTA